MTKLPSLKLRFIGIPTFRHFNSMVPTFKMTEKDRSNHWALWRTPKTRLVTRFIYEHQRKLLTPGKIGLRISLTIVLYLTKSHNNNTDDWRNCWLVTRFIYEHQRKLLTPGKIGLKIWLTIVLYLTKSHNNDTDNWRNYWGDNTPPSWIH